MKFSEALDLIARWTAGEIPPKSDEEIKVRRLVAGLVRASGNGLLLGFANVIDPDTYGPKNRTGITFKRPPGNRSKTVDSRNLAAVIWHEERAGRKRNAYKRAAKRLNVSVRTAKAAYSYWKPLFESHRQRLRGLTQIED